MLECFWFLPTGLVWRVDYKRLDYKPLATVLVEQQRTKNNIQAADGPVPNGIYTQMPTTPIAPDPALAQPGSAPCDLLTYFI